MSLNDKNVRAIEQPRTLYSRRVSLGAIRKRSECGSMERRPITGSFLFLQSRILCTLGLPTTIIIILMLKAQFASFVWLFESFRPWIYPSTDHVVVDPYTRQKVWRKNNYFVLKQPQLRVIIYFGPENGASNPFLGQKLFIYNLIMLILINNIKINIF